MSKQTTNYKFIKPELTDPANITALDSNWDTLDETLFNIVESVENLDTNVNNKLKSVQTKITCGTSAPSGGKSGDVYIQLLD